MSASQSRVYVSRLAAASGVGAAYVDDQRVEVAAQEDERRRRRELDARGDARHLRGGQTSSLDELLGRRSWPHQDSWAAGPGLTKTATLMSGWPPVMASPRRPLCTCGAARLSPSPRAAPPATSCRRCRRTTRATARSAPGPPVTAWQAPRAREPQLLRQQGSSLLVDVSGARLANA